MALYRICTERLEKPFIASVIAIRFPGFTIIDCDGYWQGLAENSMVIEIECGRSRYLDILQLALEIKTLNKQEAVLIQTIPCESELV